MDWTRTRNLFSIPVPKKVESGRPNVNSKLLAKLSGYYQLPANGKQEDQFAFLSVVGLYQPSSSGKQWTVKIGVSADGVTSKEYVFGKTMSFDGETLRTPDLELTFKHG